MMKFLKKGPLVMENTLEIWNFLNYYNFRRGSMRQFLLREFMEVYTWVRCAFTSLRRLLRKCLHNSVVNFFVHRNLKDKTLGKVVEEDADGVVKAGERISLEEVFEVDSTEGVEEVTLNTARLHQVMLIW